ncbi:Pentatricopeptide repeat-containing protein [Tripterygium wilfordii]|uniref:Pentatricopeptide repeat-containing protein n=1 Tax=Tripterygium wilfordii TaxID=458696 RepID=A0A7J7CNY6_TRIWF|nr:putative pentatricopeptide repeat-containing protein At3g01580 [Tripterygium wilfordii]KAF5735787.1 Pentatricopeptide repeat-containing protein [Tripterygium wilfordii]
MQIPLPANLQKQSFFRNQTHLKKDWNSIIKHHTKLKDDHAILYTYAQMESLSIPPDNTTLPLVFKACTRLNAVEKGKRIHSTIKGTPSMEDVRVGTAVMDFYCKCGFLKEARHLFDEMCDRDLVSWNAMISGYVSCGFYKEAIVLFLDMQRKGLKPNSRTVVQLLLACREVSELRLGQEIHGYCTRNRLFDSDPHVGTALIGFYLQFDVRKSCLVFDSMLARNIVSWNAMINGYVEVGDSSEALNLFLEMLRDGVKFDSVSILAVVQACAEIGSFELAMQIHQIAIKCDFYGNDLFIMNALINMYSEIGSLELASKLFDIVPAYDVALWNSMIAAYNDSGYYEEATSLFCEMRAEGIQEDERTIVIMLSLCAALADGLKKVKSLHAHARKSGMKLDVSLGNSLLGVYAELNCVESVQKVFAEMSNVDEISYYTSISTLASNDMITEAWELLGMMRDSETKPNSYTMISILATCKDETCLNIGRSIHGFAIKHGIQMNTSLNTALTEMYMNCGDEVAARNLFEACPNRDLISWNALIASYIKNNQAHEALLLFNRMISEVEPNAVTIINVLSSCTHLANLPQGQCLHAYITRRQSSLGFDFSLANAFIAMYARCGNMKSAETIFRTSPSRNVITWNAMITGYGMHGRGTDAILAFSKMLEDGLQPNGVTFLSVLSACRHSGLIDIGLQLFHSMVQDFNVTPELAHYGCVVDLLGREGRLDEANKFIKSMPFEPDATVWRALLSSCRVQSNTEVAKAVFENLVELEPLNAGNYILLSNIYAAAGLWSEVRKVRTWLKEKSLRKPPGISWIVIRDQVHSFTAGDTSHPQSEKIYANLTSLSTLLKDAGYVPDLSWFLLHAEESETES